jgi:hypothetical protein
MSPDTFLSLIDDGLEFLASMGGPRVTDLARRELLAIALTEAGPKLDARYQNSPSPLPGPARSFWQMEQGGGVAGVLNHSASRTWARQACAELAVVADPAAIWRAIEGNDVLACCWARLLLWTDPAPLPTTQQAGWDYYLRLWRPGRPHPEVWPANWANATATVSARPSA